MFEKEIEIFKWKISEKLKRIKFEFSLISEDEQECHFNIMRKGFNEKESPEILVDCSYQKYITKLKNSELFLLTDILISTIIKDKKLGGYILEVRGSMPLKGVSIRSKFIERKKLTDEQKRTQADRMRKARKIKKYNF